MAGSSLLALIDDIASILDDVAVMTKAAAKKTSGVLGDDLALNAEQVSGVDAAREIPVILKVAKGSLVNKAILVPLALVLSYFAPALITPLLILGGLFLCFEGFEKVLERALAAMPSQKAHIEQKSKMDSEPKMQTEEAKIKGAIGTDFILSAEIIVITLGSVAEKEFSTQILVLSAIGIIMTVGVYGLVAAIIKIDDLGLWLLRRPASYQQQTGKILLSAAPLLMKLLGVVGTLAMFLVGGGLITHSVPALHHLQESFGSSAISSVFDGVVGLVAGGLCVGALHLVQVFRQRKV